MASSFREYLQAEMSAIRASVGHEEHQDPETFTQRAIDWIENNAHRFRSEWERHNRAIDTFCSDRVESTSTMGGLQ
jgi:hypothetical protein